MVDKVYIVIDANNSVELAVLVNEALERDWILAGGVSVAHVPPGPLTKNDGGTVFQTPQRMSYAQALTKTEADADDGALHMFAKDWAG